MDTFTPTPADKFSFGLWTVGWQGVDVFGAAVRPPLAPADAVRRLADLGAYGISFHDNDVFPFGCSASRARPPRGDAAGRPGRDRAGGADGDDELVLAPGVPRRRVHEQRSGRPPIRHPQGRRQPRSGSRGRRQHVRRLGWAGGCGVRGGQGRARCARPLQGGVRRARPVRARPGLPDRVRPGAQAERAARRHPAADRRSCPGVHREPWSTPSSSGVNPEVGHEEMASLNFAHGLAQALWHGKLFHVDLNGQHGPRYDQDLRFGAGNARGAFWTVDILESGGYTGPRHFDFKPPRTEDMDGVWASAAACMRNYLILRDKVAAFRSDPDVVAALRDARVDQLARADARRRRDDRHAARRAVRPRCRGAAGDGVRAARPARPRAPVRHP